MTGFVSTLVDRNRERQAIDTILDAARDGLSGSLVLRGAAGMGKTSLLRYVTTAGADFTQLTVAGIGSESDFAFAGLQRLLLPVIDQRSSLPAVQREGLEVALGLSSGASKNPFLLGLGVLTILAAVATDRPLLCEVDDAQWLDNETLEALAFVARRLQAEGVAMFFAFRDDGEAMSALDDLEAIQVDGLATHDALILLNRSALSPVDPTIANRIVNETQGCPLALVEVPRELSADELAGLAVLSEPLPLGRRLEAHFLRRIRSLPADAQTLMVIIAADASGDEGAIRRAAARLDIPLMAAESAVDADLMERASWTTFRHPLIRSAVYGGASSALRRNVHGALADATNRSEAPDRYAWHRAASASEPDELIAVDLEAAAARARDRGGYASEATFRTRAAELTPGPSDRSRRMLDAAQAALTAGLRERAILLIDEALKQEASPSPLLLAQAQRLRAGCDSFTLPGGAAAVHLAVARSLEDLDVRLARDTYIEALQATVISAQLTSGTSPGEVAHAALSAPRPDNDQLTLADAMLDGFATRLASGSNESIPLFRAALDTLSEDEVAPTGRTLWAMLVQTAALEVWDAVGYRRALDLLEQSQRARGELDSLRITLLALCRSEMWNGRFGAAEAYRAEVGAIAAAIEGEGPIADMFVMLSVHLLAWQGREAEVREAVSILTGEFAVAIGAGAGVNVARLALATLENGLRHYGEALTAASPLFDDDIPPDGNLILPEIVEAGVRSGNNSVAAAALDRLDERARISGTPWAFGLLARSRALLAADDDAEALYMEAIEQLDGSPVAAESARAHLLYGEWLRRQKRRIDARRELRTAHQLFSTMGARAFEERARLELAATGAHARERSAVTALDLTPQESQIARLAARGDSNAEIASKLYISPNTVDYHLRKVYRKLALRSRRDLRRLFT
jgi:DNA-binding CsgD family transcriptional regulator